MNTLQPIFKAATPEQIANRPKPKSAFHNEYNGYVGVVGHVGVQGPTGTTGVAGMGLPRITALLPSLVMDVQVEPIERREGSVYYFNVVKLGKLLWHTNKIKYWWRKITHKKNWDE